MEAPQQVDRHEHVDVEGLAVHLLLHQQRPDADQVALRVEQRRAAPLRMGRRGEQRLVEHVLPVAGKFLLCDDPRPEGVGAAAVSDHEGRIADLDVGCQTALKVRGSQLAQRLDQAEPGRLVVGERVAGHGGAAIGGEPDLRCLVDEVADREHEAVLADHRAVTAALGPERGSAVGIFRNFGANQHHRVERALEVELGLAGPRLNGFRESPNLIFGHGDILRYCVADTASQVLRFR